MNRAKISRAEATLWGSVSSYINNFPRILTSFLCRVEHLAKMKKAKKDLMNEYKHKVESVAGQKRGAVQRLDEIWITDTQWRKDILQGRIHLLSGSTEKVKNDEVQTA